jgi:hypothetical protein
MKNILNRNQKRNQLQPVSSISNNHADSMIMNKTYMNGNNNSCSKRKDSKLKNEYEKNQKSISKTSQTYQVNSESFSHYTGKINLYNYSNKIKNPIENEKENSNNSIYKHSNHENNKENKENKEKLIKKETKKWVSLNKSLVYAQLNTSSIHNQNNNQKVKNKLSLDNTLIVKSKVVKNSQNKSNFLDESLNLKKEKENSSFNKLQKNYILNSKFLKKGLNIRK